MGNRPNKAYDYSRAGVAMITLKARPGVRLCRITQETFELTEVGRIVRRELAGISVFYGQIKLGHYQIMPDHLHALVHVVRDLPAGVTLQRVVRGFKIGVDRACRAHFETASYRVFEKGMYDSLVFDREHLAREVAYIRDNVRRHRLRCTHADLFRRPKRVLTLPDGVELWGFGNLFLMEHPRRVQVRFSRRAAETEWLAEQELLSWYVEQGYVFVSPFISPFEKRALREVAARGGRAIRLTHDFFDERYKPSGELFDLCCAGRLLEVSAAGAFERFARLDRGVCERLNEMAGVIATTQWSRRRG